MRGSTMTIMTSVGYGIHTLDSAITKHEIGARATFRSTGAQGGALEEWGRKYTGRIFRYRGVQEA